MILVEKQYLLSLWKVCSISYLLTPTRVQPHHTSKNDNDSLMQGPHTTTPLELNLLHSLRTNYTSVGPSYKLLPNKTAPPPADPHSHRKALQKLSGQAPGGRVRTPLLIFSDPRRLRVWKEEEKPQANLCGSQQMQPSANNDVQKPFCSPFSCSNYHTGCVSRCLGNLLRRTHAQASSPTLVGQ